MQGCRKQAVPRIMVASFRLSIVGFVTHSLPQGCTKHVGTQSCVSGSLAQELKSRLASMHGVSTSLGRYFFRRPQMPVASKLLVARALLLSKRLFSAGTWPTLNASEHKKLHQARMKVIGGLRCPTKCTYLHCCASRAPNSSPHSSG